jgi:hypothetical protein
MLQDRKVEILLGTYTLAALHVYNLGQRTKAGSAERALACMPVFLCNLFVPFLFDRHKEPCLFLIMVFGTTWQANFKARLSQLFRACRLCDLSLEGMHGLRRWQGSASTEAACVRSLTSCNSGLLSGCP